MDYIFEMISGFSAPAVYGTAFGVLIACGLGVPIPEDITLFALGFMTYQGVVTLEGSIIVAMVGVLAGDSFIFLLGRSKGKVLLENKTVQKVIRPGAVTKVQKSFERFGKAYVFFARFAPGLRAPTYFVAGYSGVRFSTFFLLDGIAAAISVPLFIYLGYASGGMIEHVKEYERIIGIVALTVIIGLVVHSIRAQKKAGEADSPTQDTDPKSQDHSSSELDS